MSADRWDFNRPDYDKFSEWRWHLPSSVVADGTLAKLWRDDNTSRGGGAAISVLPILALHTMHNGPMSQWWSLCQRRLAALSGLSRETVRVAFHQLSRAGLLEYETRKRDAREGGFKIYYRLRGDLTGSGGTKGSGFARISGGIFYNGAWSLLPCASARQLYVVIAAMDAVKDEDSYVAAASGGRHEIQPYSGEHRSEFYYQADEEQYRAERAHARIIGAGQMCERFDRDNENGIAIARAILTVRREQDAISMSELARLCGFPRSTAIRAIRYLTTPLFGGSQDGGKVYYAPVPLVEHDRSPQGTIWYAPNRHAGRWTMGFDRLNDATTRRQIVRARWPFHPVPKPQGKRKSPSTPQSLRVA